MVIIVSVFIFVLDLAFDYMNKFEVEQVKKLQNSISANETVEDTNTTTDNTNTDENTSATEDTNETATNSTENAEADSGENTVSE